MRRKMMVGWAVVVASLLVLSLDSPANAALGCFRDSGPAVATCSADSDCAAVGGAECTNGFCFCPDSPTSPFCACEALQAPALSQRALFGSAMLVFAIGLLGLWRQMNRGRNPA